MASSEYTCNITKEPMSDPAIASDGYTYERAAIEEWLRECKDKPFSPVTGDFLASGYPCIAGSHERSSSAGGS